MYMPVVAGLLKSGTSIKDFVKPVRFSSGYKLSAIPKAVDSGSVMWCSNFDILSIAFNRRLSRRCS